MIVLHPNSVCDVCLEGYGANNAPYAIACGHIFCIGCLRSLNRPACPLCRCGFQAQDVRKLHVDESSRSTSPLSASSSSGSDSRPPSPQRNGAASEARELQTRITHIVLDGAQSLAEVRDLIEEVREWLNGRSADKHTDLRAAWFLLFKYSNVMNKFKDSKEIITNLQQDIDDLKGKMRTERENAEARYQELAEKRMKEMETAIGVERGLRDHFDKMNDEWRMKCDTITAQYIRLQDELRKLKQKPLAGLARSSEARGAHSNDRSPELMAVVEDEDPEESPLAENQPFVLSPIPPSATLPISNRPNRQVFRPLTAEESDVEDLKSRKTNPYLLRSIDPISIRPSVHRMNSNSSLMSRHDADNAGARPIPRPSADVHMASCSSSPVATQTLSRDRDDPMHPASAVSPQETSRSSKFGERKGSSSNTQPYDESQHERWRAQLHNILETPQMNMDCNLRSPEARQRPIPKPESPDSSAPVTRTTSPTSPASSAAASSSAQPIHNSTLLRPPLSRASTAAKQAERERARSLSGRDSSTSFVPASQASPAREKESHSYSQSSSPPPPPAPAPTHYYPRRPSVSSSTRGKPTTFASQPSNLTRSMWALQDPQRTS